MPRKPAPALPPPTAADLAEIDFMLRFFLRLEIGDDQRGWREDLALECPTFRELLRQAHAAPHGPLSLTRLWEAAGSPEGLDPRVRRPADHGGVIEDRGEAGVFGEWEAASWFAHELDPGRVTIDVAVDLTC